jgi:hypothetical protein
MGAASRVATAYVAGINSPFLSFPVVEFGCARYSTLRREFGQEKAVNYDKKSGLPPKRHL